MKLYECEVKAHLQRRGASVPRGVVVLSAHDAVRAAREHRLPVMLKAQLLSGGRGRAGLVRRADTVEDVEREAKALWQGSLHGEPVRYVLVEEALPAARELYLSISVDDREGVPILLAGAHGGVDVEERAAEEREGFWRTAIDPVTGLRQYQALAAGEALGLTGPALRSWGGLVAAAWKTFVDLDATLVEINPVIVDGEGVCWTADGKAEVDDNAAFRQRDLTMLDRPPAHETPLEQKARAAGITFVDLEGEVAVLSAGAGLTMAILDAIHAHGVRPANFVDVSGGASLERIIALGELILEKAATDPRVRVVLLNVVIAGTSLATVIAGFEEAFRRRPPAVPVVGCVRATGAATHELSLEEGRRRLAALGVELVEDTPTAVARAAALAKAAVRC
ncbi:MAG TPA: ATP-grasp domain-containing protein [Limnochordales bacterium]